MTISTRTSKLILTSHITSSVGWLGAVAVFLALAITALTSQDLPLVKACCLAMDVCTWLIILPFCLTSLFTGIIQATLTKWGLFKHYWIVVKLFLTLASTLLLFLHLQPISYLAGVAREASFSNTLYAGQLISIISKAGAAVLVLIALTTISVYKPWGKIQSIQNGNYDFNTNQNSVEKIKKSLTFYLLIGFVTLIVIFIITHLFGGSMTRH
jgi:hypothetical protein